MILFISVVSDISLITCCFSSFSVKTSYVYTGIADSTPSIAEIAVTSSSVNPNVDSTLISINLLSSKKISADSCISDSAAFTPAKKAVPSITIRQIDMNRLYVFFMDIKNSLASAFFFIAITYHSICSTGVGSLFRVIFLTCPFLKRIT